MSGALRQSLTAQDSDQLVDLGLCFPNGLLVGGSRLVLGARSPEVQARDGGNQPGNFHVPFHYPYNSILVSMFFSSILIITPNITRIARDSLRLDLPKPIMQASWLRASIIVGVKGHCFRHFGGLGEG